VTEDDNYFIIYVSIPAMGGNSMKKLQLVTQKYINPRNGGQ